MAREVTTDSSGLAAGVSYIDKRTGRENHVRARIVVLAASACVNVEIPLFSGGGRLEERVLSGKRGPKIALVDLSGTLGLSASRGLLGLPGGESSVARLREELERAAADDEVAAVVLRIDTPGGTVIASEILYGEVARFKQRTGRPVVAQLMGIAASGGYYVAMAADRVQAYPAMLEAIESGAVAVHSLCGLTMYAAPNVVMADSNRIAEAAAKAVQHLGNDFFALRISFFANNSPGFLNGPERLAVVAFHDFAQVIRVENGARQVVLPDCIQNLSRPWLALHDQFDDEWLCFWRESWIMPDQEVGEFRQQFPGLAGR